MLIIAHRGSSHTCPENTKPAFNTALLQEADGIELDLQMTRDGIPVVYHDRTLQKVGHGRKKIHTLSYAELSRLDFGAWFNKAFSGEHIVSLDEVLRSFAGTTKLFLEVKNRGTSEHCTALSALAADRVLREKTVENIYFLSFQPQYLEVINKKSKTLKTVLNCNRVSSRTVQSIDCSRLQGINLPVQYLSAELVSFYHRKGKEVFVYGCNSRWAVYRAVRLGADGLMTDMPDKACTCVRNGYRDRP